MLIAIFPRRKSIAGSQEEGRLIVEQALPPLARKESGKMIVM